MVVRNRTEHEPAWEALRGAIRLRCCSDTLFSDDGSSVDEQVAFLEGRTVAVAGSCHRGGCSRPG